VHNLHNDDINIAAVYLHCTK